MTAPNVDPAKVDIDRLFHALGDPTRRAILDRLAQGPLSVSNLAGPLGITLTAVMQHLQILEECELAHTEKVGRVRHLPDCLRRAGRARVMGEVSPHATGTAAGSIGRLTG